MAQTVETGFKHIRVFRSEYNDFPILQVRFAVGHLELATSAPISEEDVQTLTGGNFPPGEYGKYNVLPETLRTAT